ncbi:MAG: A/G-specific adenine glycosylase [Pseudomonadota bacterium]
MKWPGVHTTLRAMSQFAETLIAWQAHHGRHDLPWQQTRDPYRVWLSEIMLQQTQVDTVVPYYQRFLARFPDVASLAAAPLDEVLALWSGLGYYARARNLHRAAQGVMQAHGGTFPGTAADLQALPGIGRSTAAAIAAFCFGEKVAILDGNVKRVLCRHFGIEGFPGERAIEQQLWALAESLLPATGNDIYPQAQMDLGATVCTRTKPRCLHCPVNATCIARESGREHLLPTARPRKATPQRACGMLLITSGDAVLLEKRPNSGIWGGLYSLPELQTDETPEAGAFRCFGWRDLRFEEGDPVRHTFTHFQLTILPWYACIGKSAIPNGKSVVWVSAREISEHGLPAPIRMLIERALVSN